MYFVSRYGSVPRMFNANFNHIVIVRLIGELLPSGGVLPSTVQNLLEPTLVRIIPHVVTYTALSPPSSLVPNVQFHSSADWVQMVFQILILVQTIYFLVIEVWMIVQAFGHC